MNAVLALLAVEIQNRNDRIEELIAAIAEDDASSMGALYDLIKTDVFAFALSRTRNRQDANDVVQDTFVQIFKHARGYDPKGKPMAWIITVELNLIRRRERLKTRTVCLDETYENAPSDDDLEKNVTDNVFLRNLLCRLSEEERQTVVLHVVSGLKHREIAKIYGKPLSTVLSEYNRAIKKLQRFAKQEKS